MPLRREMTPTGATIDDPSCPLHDGALKSDAALLTPPPPAPEARARFSPGGDRCDPANQSCRERCGGGWLMARWRAASPYCLSPWQLATAATLSSRSHLLHRGLRQPPRGGCRPPPLRLGYGRPLPRPCKQATSARRSLTMAWQTWQSGRNRGERPPPWPALPPALRGKYLALRILGGDQLD